MTQVAAIVSLPPILQTDMVAPPMTGFRTIKGHAAPNRLVLVIALLITSLGALLPAQGTMSGQMILAQTGPAISVDQIVSGDKIIKQASCLNGSDHELPADHDCQLCCSLLPVAPVAAPVAALPSLEIRLVAYFSADIDRGTAVAPQAYHGRAPPPSV